MGRGELFYDVNVFLGVGAVTEYIRDLYHDELREGFLVTFDRKKVWQVELALVMVLDGICKEHGLRYFMGGETLLGAVRHQGFIPWVDRVVLMMPRPDYARLKAVMEGALPAEYFWQDVYTDARFVGGGARLQDSRTTAIEDPIDKVRHQGISIEIVPLDDLSDGSPEEEELFAVQGEMWAAVSHSEGIREGLRQGARSLLSPAELLALLALSREERMRQFERIAVERYGTSRRVGDLTAVICGEGAIFARSWFETLVELPFEGLRLPAPAGYDAILRQAYGAYRTFQVPDTMASNILFSADLPYTKCIEEIDFS